VPEKKDEIELMPTVEPPRKSIAKTTELIGEFSHEIARTVRGSDDSDERWSVKAFIVDGLELEISGIGRKDKFVRGDSYFMLVEKFTKEPYGVQRRYSSIQKAEPVSLTAITRYLQHAKGIGEKAAMRIVGEYGTQSLEACRERPTEVEIKCGIKQSVMSELRGTLIRNKRLEKVTMEVEELIHGRGFPRTLATKVIETWGVNAIETIRENPYKLRSFHGVGFKTCDALYQHLGLPMDAMIRQVQCVLHAIESDISGSTWIAKKQIADLVNRNIGGAKPRLEDAIRQAVDEGLIRERGGWFASADCADAESSFVSDIYAAVQETVGEDGF